MYGYRTVVALDLGQYTVKAIRAERHGKTVRLIKGEMLRLPVGATDKADVIGRWLDKLGFLKLPCVVGFSSQHTMFQPLTVAADDPRSPDQIAAIEIARFNELASETTVYGFAPFSGRSGEKRLLLAMARPTALDAALALPQKLGMEVVDIIPASAALFAATEHAGFGQAGPYVAADIGHAVTEMAAGTRGGLMFARSFAAGGRLFTDTLAKVSDLPTRQAESLKETPVSIADRPDTDQAALAKAADLWVSEFQSAVSVLRSSISDEGDLPKRLVLSGGGSELAGLADYLRGKLDLEILPARQPLLEGVGAPSRFLIATGLALAALSAEGKTISLLPPPLQDELLFRTQKKYWIAAGVTAALILAVSLAGGYRDFKRMERQMNVQRDSLRRCQELAQQIESIKAQNRVIQEMVAPVQTLLQNGPLFRDVLGRLAESKHPDDWITLVADADSYFSGSRDSPGGGPPGAAGRRGYSAGAGPAGPPADAFSRVIIEGYTRRMDLSTVKTLISSLQSAAFVESADLLGDDEIVREAGRESEWSGLRGRRFVIDVRIAGRRLPSS